MSSSSTTHMASDRGEQILSAKKKLQKYRAKQALMAQKRSSTSSSHARSDSGARSTDVPPTTAVAAALSNQIVSQAPTSSVPTASASTSHARTASRSAHGRGHSRAGSISITPDPLFAQAQAIATSPAPTSSSVPGRPASIVAPNASRMHSRTHSRNFSLSRPVSISMLGAKKKEPVVLAIEHRAETDIPKVSNAQRRSQQFLDSSILFGGSVSSSLRPSSASTDRFSNLSPVSPALFDRPASQSMAAPSPSASAANLPHSRRLSRHARTPSVATKRESMEIMGGVGAAGLGLDMTNTPTSLQSMGSSRRHSSRMSNLPSASLLFASAVPSSANSNSNHDARVSGQQWDWRKAIADAAEEAEEGAQGRLSALDKLEGRTSPARSTPADCAPSSAGAGSRASRRLSGHTRTESIQIPNLEEIHQNEINEQRASWNAAHTLDAALNGSGPVPNSAPVTSSRRESWGRSLVPPSTSSFLSAGFSSPALPSAYHSSPGRPDSIILRPESPQPEGLGTLMEEEEEEDASSPTRERQSMDMLADGSLTAEQEATKQRRQMEDEIVKRNRRASLAPKPLKLKSRPPSLYLTPSQRTGLVSSPSMPNSNLSPLMPPSISDEVTPKASTAALPEAAKGEETTVGMPSRSTTCPDLSTIAAAEVEQKPAVAEVEAQGTQDATSFEATEVNAEEKANEEQRQLMELQQQILRAHRNSVIAPIPTPVSADSTSASSGSASSRQGMRTLRLGSQANLTSIMEAGSAGNSTTSGSVNGSITTTPAQRRRSLIMGPLSAAPLGGSSSRDSDHVNAFGGSSASSRAARRSSIIYKPSTASVPEAPSSPSASDSIASLGGVPLAVHDELKAKANCDAALLESTKRQVEMLERELANETERSAREKAELEQWNLDKEEHLFDRAQRAETAARQAQDALDAMRAEFEQTKEQLEDLQAEREVLKDDIEGWRSRCQDLEKTLRTEKFKSDENRKLRAAARLRIKQLTDAIEQGAGAVPTDELKVLSALEQSQLDLTHMLRSPNLGAVSPSLGVASSPSLGHEDAPPQITQLLAQMRQQIFNLAGSLEHERKQHVHAKEEIARLQQQQPSTQPPSEEKASAATEEHSFDFADESRDDGGMSNSESFSSSVRRSSGLLGKNKRHVFAYDSSMGSFGQSLSSASLSMHTDETAHTDNDSDMSDSFFTKLPSSSESELVGLGMGSLQTLDEIEEVSEVSESVEGSNGTLGASVDKGAASPAWIDVEASAVRPSLDMSESSFGATYQDAENAPPTPDLFRSNETATRFANPNEYSNQPSSCSSSGSGDSHATPATPPLQHDERTPPSPRPEFHREWSFEWGKSRSRKLHSTSEGVEDFFGILNEDVLPPLSNSEEPLDLPPIIVQGNGLLPTAKINKDGKPISTTTSGMRAASIFGGKRPPVARSAYLRESFDSTHPNSQSSVLQDAFRGHESQLSSASSLAAIGSRALSRMSLQGITGAFSGLSGYLTSQHGAASVAVGAAKMCNTTSSSALEGGLNWATQRHTFEEEDEEKAFDVRKARFDIEGGMMVNYGSKQQLSWSSGSSSLKQQVGQQAGLTRRYVKKASVQPPKATPIWLLDFTKSTQVANTPVFTL
ncbi:hypothetical protein NDA11_000534 [Ustilago hordei]|uniref:Uncharacterized protein n=1 Tax=Ustilago hordei TaxID=120017 RepID=I2G3C1_USTHO|nr:uncharacterized protein UHO2_02935 [Ustilago hordei]KAJ1592677.1 hypothetical protein NDA11_000534 [Ustilago hordei]CCF53664.1 uncharacterized protein UHOR_02252 [Ustilago hordei]SYW78923.1 uncharacterized protein UHO2_02935 [Ustilago hordei]